MEANQQRVSQPTTPHRRPRLIIVNGAPATGKTTLASLLSQRLGLPLIAKDRLKEVLMEEFGADSVEQSRLLGRASIALLCCVADSLLRAGTGTFVESPFIRGLSEQDLRPLISLSTPCMIHCQAPPAVVIQRYQARADDGVRHRRHRDAERTASLEDQLAAGSYEPLDLPIPVLRVDTQWAYDPPLEVILNWLDVAGGE